MRTSINTCFDRVVSRFINRNKNATKEELEEFKERKKGMFSWYKKINEFIMNIDKL